MGGTLKLKEETKLTFWRKLKFSVFDFEKYQELAAQKISKTIGYIAILVFIFAFIVAGMSTYKFTVAMGSIRQYIEENIETITFEENELNVIPKNHEEITTIENELFGIKIIINTQTQDKEKITQSINELGADGNEILILKDKILLKNKIMTAPYTHSYSTLAQKNNNNKIDKKQIIKLLSIDTMKPLLIKIYRILLMYFFVIMYLPSTLIDIVILSVFGYIVALISKMKLKYSAVYNIAAYALTLPILLNVLYFIVNSFTGFQIQYFEVMYTTVATIYITAAILMIRSDVIKKQIELTKILEEQDKIRLELERKEEEQKQEEEKERQKREEEKKRKQEEKEEGNIGTQPKGNECIMERRKDVRE